jgi:hypothetical protein
MRGSRGSALRSTISTLTAIALGAVASEVFPPIGSPAIGSSEQANTLVVAHPMPTNQNKSGASAADPTPLDHLDALLGAWEGTLSGPAPDGGTLSLPIRWRTDRAFDGRAIRFEFTSTQPNAAGRHLEFEGLFFWNAEAKQIETIWMNPRIRMQADARVIDNRLMFFETGSFDETGRVLTLHSKQQRGPDAPIITVRSTFRLEAADHFTVIDEELDAAGGEPKVVGVFDLKKVN